jgi:hypothetical protein
MRATAGVAAAVALLAAIAAAAAHAQSSLGAGGVTCSQFLKAARTGDILYHQASNWLLGYVSGMNGALQAAGSRAAAIDLTADQLLKSAGDYCEAHPSSPLAAAAAQWYALLPRQAAVPAPPPQRGWTLDLNKGSGYRGPK